MTKEVNKKIREFLKSNKFVLKIPYSNKHLNPTKTYHSSLSSNPFFFIWKSVIIGITTILPASGFKNFLLRLTGMKIGKQVSISAGVIFDLGYPKLITINDGTIIGTGTKILTHETTIDKIRLGRVTIGKQALIGVRSIIRSGVKIGNNSIIGLGSVVVKDIPDNTFVSGVPARKIKDLRTK